MELINEHGLNRDLNTLEIIEIIFIRILLYFEFISIEDLELDLDSDSDDETFDNNAKICIKTHCSC